MGVQFTESMADVLAPCGDNRDVEIRIARSAAEVESLREPWTEWGGHRDSDIDFVLMIIESYPEALRPQVIAVYRHGKPDAILIGRLEEKRLSFKVGYLSLLRPKARCLTFVYGALRGNASAENTRVLVGEVINCLKHDEADIALFECVPTESALYRLGLKLPSFLIRDTAPAVQGHEAMKIPTNVDEVYQRMSSDRRIELRRRVRKLQAHAGGAPRIVCYTQLSDIELLFQDVEEVAKKTYQRGLGAGFADTTPIRRRLELGARQGWLRANVLYLGDRPVAFWIGMLYRGTFVSEYLGYDPEFRKLSPGMVLIMRVIEGFCSRTNGDNVKELDFGLGHAEYKAVLSSRSWMEGSVFIFSPTWKSLFLKVLRTSILLVDGIARNTLASTTYFSHVKKWWRDRLSRNAGRLAPTGRKSASCAAAERQ